MTNKILRNISKVVTIILVVSSSGLANSACVSDTSTPHRSNMAGCGAMHGQFTDVCEVKLLRGKAVCACKRYSLFTCQGKTYRHSVVSEHFNKRM